MFSKKLILLVVSFLVFTISASNTEKSVGIKTRFGLCGFSGEDADELNPNYSMSGNIFYLHRFSPFFAVQPELLFVRKGCSLKGIPGGSKLAYLEIPILFKGTLPTKVPFKPFIFAGPSLAILLSAKAEVSGFVQKKYDIKDDMNPVDLGILFGIGTDIEVGPGNIVLDFSYEPGLIHVAKEKNGIQPEMKNYCFGFSVGYAISF